MVVIIMRKMTNEKFDIIMSDRNKKRKQEKAKREALRQYNYEKYSNDYHDMVQYEKKVLEGKRNINLSFSKLFFTAFVLFCVFIYLYFLYFEHIDLIDFFILNR